MNQFQVSPVKRLISRMYFYATILFGSFVIGNMIPSASDLQVEQDLNLGVARAFIGVPISEVPSEFLK
ncbi:MAG: hypothetical protein P1U89_19570 [Verrucomicrobiales bacterium]|nr:hypothetical protein [Verrucomicrobiales bacterium]